MENIVKKFVILSAVFSILACSSYRPILDPNSKYLESGEAQADEDISQCKVEAEDYLDKFKAERAAREAGRKAIVGGIIGAGTGLIMGGSGKSALLGAAIGAGAGAMIAGISVYGEDKVKPDHIKQTYITNCLSRKGYSVIGWR